MEKKFIEVFAQASMPEDCARKIESKLERKQSVGTRYESSPTPESRFGWVAPVAAMLALVLAVGLILPRMQQAPAQLAEVPAEAEEPTVPSEAVDVEKMEFENGAVKIITGKVPGQGGFATGSYDTGSRPTWLFEQDGRLYFVQGGIVNGEKTDITDMISTEEPYTCVYEDGDGILHYMAVGLIHEGPFVSIDESLGWCCWYRDSAEMEVGIYAGWKGGFGHGHWSNELDAEFGWYTKAKEIMDIPWDR